MKDRKFVRLKVNIDVTYKKLFEFGEDGSKTQNVSEDGLCLTLPERLSMDRHIELALNVPDGEPIVAKARVVWTRADYTGKNFLTGLQFVEIDKDARKRLKSYAETNSIKG